MNINLNDNNILYSILSEDEQIVKFKEFHTTETRTIALFLIQIGYLRFKMLNVFKDMINLHYEICKKIVFLSYKKHIKDYKYKEIRSEYKNLKRSYKDYKRKKLEIKKYIKKIDNSTDKEILSSLNSLILYEKIIQKLYKNKIKDEKNIKELILKI